MVKQIGFSGNYCFKKPVLQMLLCKFEVKGLQTSFWLNALTVAAMVSFPGQLILGTKNENEKEGKKNSFEAANTQRDSQLSQQRPARPAALWAIVVWA